MKRFENAQIGDKVLWITRFDQRRRNGYAKNTQSGTIEKVLKTKIVLDCGREFNLEGQNKSGDVAYLPEEIQALIAVHQEQDRINLAVSKLVVLLEGNKSYEGNYHLTREQAAAVDQLNVSLGDTVFSE